MPLLIPFRIITFILLPIAVFFGFMDLFLLLRSLTDFSALLIVFALACFVIYCFVSLRFLTRGIDGRFPQKPSLRDWIRVNAYGSLFVVYLFTDMVFKYYQTSEATLRSAFTEVIKTQREFAPLINVDMMMSTMRGFIYFLIVLSILILVHVLINFRLLKAYAHLFDKAPDPS